MLKIILEKENVSLDIGKRMYMCKKLSSRTNIEIDKSHLVTQKSCL